ncbi:M23 family metallopeptidase [Modestobacter muralis]|uniref:M23 family metallopeptidase n=1 Tax=Modestobacter muralis TaxID=1608614 RepID=A0A6P0HC15_9ACTN|nr:M23 family metallopeptidase [Modestobacter muralis]NEK96528.1 M23 family metallopeptidase [Modestobacter muralis]NEN53428.1 M23 family metallopeptidase [Modestobacter muralis]
MGRQLRDAEAPKRRRPGPPAGRRGPLLLTALVLGGFAAGLWEGGYGLSSPVAHAHEAPALDIPYEGSVSEVLAEFDARPQITELVVAERRDKLVATRAAREEAAREAARPKAVMPVNGRLTSSYGARWGTTHYGLDIAAPMRTPEYAAADGVVIRAGAASGFGLAVYILHDNGDVTVYGHMDKILVEDGQLVSAGDTIALLGNRGQSTGPHLHFEVFEGGLDGRRVDPRGWLAERGVDI